jgi:alpha-L-fucosidase
MFSQCTIKESQKQNFVQIQSNETPVGIIEKAAHIVPSSQQLKWQEMEFIAFTHFGMNTFTNREWGDGTDDPKLFNPDDFNADQWARVIRSAGMKMIILTAKHHDGFCLWPSAYSDYSVAHSTWKNGKGDVVREVAKACHKYGLKFGIYISPWDRHESFYGDTPRYNEFFENQLRELLSNYGKIAEVWFDGACGEGPNGKKQVYDWRSYYKVVRELHPDAVIAVMGPDVRWVGTESGTGRETEWSVLPDVVGAYDSNNDLSRKDFLDRKFIPRNFMDQDLGSRDKIVNAKNLYWYPAETDVSIRPGWFYHEKEDSLVKTPEELVDIYFNSVGRNSVLLLNIPPNKKGLIQQEDKASLTKMNETLKQIFKRNLINKHSLLYKVRKSKSPPQSNDVATSHCVFQDSPIQGILKELNYEWKRKMVFNTFLLQEDITKGQRIEQFHIDYWTGSEWKKCASGTTIGYKRLLRINNTEGTKIRLIIDSSRSSAIIKSFGVY